jgi:membrane-bound lytic murein transglycosylase B
MSKRKRNTSGRPYPGPAFPMPPKSLYENSEKGLAHINVNAFPPYPKTKQAFYTLIQQERSNSNNKGYTEGRNNTIKEYERSQSYKVLDALCKVSVKLAEKS